ncbi:uncharacterized protein LOC124266153 [Haliotis rubra]|uniref:uncharacterized protein LOC124266153 n=1 Tax=Haliotis rubra TaxID=36100 RepID=UPI001EE60847|nr:uncharacterized protein LOC124266153 [Haliotis rubra]
MLSDVLPLMEKLVTVFQREVLNLAIIGPMVLSTKESLQYLIKEKGENEKFLEGNMKEGPSQFRGITITYADKRSMEAFNTMRTCFIEDLVDSLDRRFPEKSLDLLQALDNVLNHDKYPDRKEDLANYGGDSLTVLLDHFCPVIGQDNNDVTTPYIDRDRSLRDFQQFKRVNSGIGSGNFDMTCKVLITEYADIFPDFSTLAEIALTIPVSSVPAERGFSLQNRIHTASRNRLAQHRMNNLMILNMHANDRFDFTRASELFRKTKKRKV